MGLLEAGGQADTFAPVLLKAIRNSLIVAPRDWGSRPGLHFYLYFADQDLVNTAVEAYLGNFGFAVSASIVISGGSNTGDFLSPIGVDPPHVELVLASQAIESPNLFGSFEHGQAIKEILGFTPTKMFFETYAKFVDTPASPTDTQILGFGEGVCYIRHDGTNFQIARDNSLKTNIQTGDNDWHIFRIRIEDAMYGSVDGGPEVSVALTTGEWPAPMKLVASDAAEDLHVAWVHIWYE